MSNNKKYNNGNKYSSNDGSWAEAHNQQISQTRKQSKFHHMKNGNKNYSKNHNNHYYNKSQTDSNNNKTTENRVSENNEYQNGELNAIVPNTVCSNCQNSVCSQICDQTINNCSLPKQEVEGNQNFSPSTDSSSSESTGEQEQIKNEINHQPNVYDQGSLQAFVPCNGQVTDVVQSDINNGFYNQTYEYDYQQQSNVPQQSQYYIYQPYQDYSQVPNIAGSPINSSLNGTPQQQHYYQAYQPIPSYIYDPQAGSYTSTYSPLQQNSQNFQQTPGNTNLSSPQQQQQPSAFLASYHTPPQPAHQLYIQTSNITPPTSLSPNDTPCTNSSGTASTDRQSNCNSPHTTQNGLGPTHLAQTPVHNSYVMYNTDISQNQYTIPPHTNAVYTPVTPQTYQCNSPLPTPQFMMYNPPPMTQGSPFQTGPNSPMVHSTHVSHTNNMNGTPKFNRYNRNRYNGNNGVNNKNNFNQKYNYTEQTTQPGQFEENNFNSNSGCAYEQEFAEQTITDANMQIFPPSYCDPSMGVLNTQDMLAAYQNYDNVESYGDEYLDGYDDNNDDENDENLACQVCRGRRMCFCYFLKVRYYKFPSFFDLIDHHYKKWRKTIHHQQIMNNQNKTNIMVQQSPNMPACLPKKA